MASDFAENELDLFRKAVSTVTPIAQQLGFLKEYLSFTGNGNCNLRGSPLLPEKALCRGMSPSASPRIHSCQVIAGEVATAA